MKMLVAFLGLPHNLDLEPRSADGGLLPLKAKKSEPNKVIIPEIVINPGDFVKRTDKVRIYFEGDKQTVRLLLVDSLPAIEKDIIAVAKDIKLG